MQLCRFVLRDDPDSLKSGIFHENRLFETDGRQALGVHELSKIILLPPIVQPPSVRVFVDSPLSWTYRNPSVFMGPLAEFDAPISTKLLDFDIHVCAVIKDRGDSLSPEEATDVILGYSLFVAFVAADQESTELGVKAYDYPFAIGPFISTPDIVHGEQDPTFKTNLSVKINGEEIYSEQLEHARFEDYLCAASQSMPILASELIVGSKLEAPRLHRTKLNRSLRPGDAIQIQSDTLGILTLKIV